jgi:site-specific recombinase XerC
MTTIESAAMTIRAPGDEYEVDEAQLAAVSFLARYSGRALEAYRHDLRGFFQWATDHGIAIMQASRAHIELFRAWMEERGLAASTIDRRLSTVCGFYRFAHIDGRIRSNPAQYVRRPQVHPSDARGMDRSELGVFLFTAEQYDRDHAALAVLLGLNGLRVSEACATNVAHRISAGSDGGEQVPVGAAGVEQDADAVVAEAAEPEPDALDPLDQVVDRFGRPVRHVRLMPGDDLVPPPVDGAAE